MPKLIDYLRKYSKPVKVILSAVNPAYGIGAEIIETLFIKPKETTMKFLEGKKTYIGIGVTALAFVAQFLGYEVSAEEQSGLNEAITAVIGALGLMFATYGRVKTTKK